MAIKLPTIETTFKQLAGSLTQRSQRGITALIIKDNTDESFSYTIYKDAAEVEAEIYTDTNFRYIKDLFTFAPSKCIIVRMSAETEEEISNKITLNQALKTLESLTKTGWITIADATETEYSDLASWIKAREKEGKTYKAAVYKTAADNKHIVSFANEKVTFSDERGEQAGSAYLPSLISLLATCNIQRGAAYFNCTNLKKVQETEDTDKALNAGEFILINDEDTVKVGLGINSLTTIDGINLTEDMKFIDVVEVMDMIADDIKDVFKTNYIGQYKNNYDNQVLLISSINVYLKELAADNILDNNYNNRADVDVTAQRNAWLGVGKTEASGWDEQTVKNNSFKRTVFLAGDIKILGAMENLKFEVSLF